MLDIPDCSIKGQVLILAFSVLCKIVILNNKSVFSETWGAHFFIICTELSEPIYIVQSCWFPVPNNDELCKQEAYCLIFCFQSIAKNRIKFVCLWSVCPRRRRRSSSSSSHSSSRRRRSRSVERDKGRSHRSHRSRSRDRR